MKNESKNFYQQHGLSKSHLYSIWNQLKNRCVRTGHPLFQKFGKVGIQMHADWINDFFTFMNWANEHGYQEGLFLRRKNNEGDFIPENCFFSTKKEIPIRKKSEHSSFYHYPSSDGSNPEEIRLKNIWKSIKDRCTKPKSKDYRFYGAKGITICDEWLEHFHSFKDWSTYNGYRSDLILGRKNTHLGFNPTNCHWTTIQIQNRERSSNIRIEVEGEEKTLYDLADAFGVSPSTIRGRLERGWDTNDLIKPVGTIEIDGKTFSFKEAEDVTGISSSTLMGRFYRGKTDAHELLQPSRSYQRYPDITIGDDTHSLKEWAEITGIQYPTLLSRYKNGLKGDALIQKVKKSSIE